MKASKKWLICALTALSMGLVASATACKDNGGNSSDTTSSSSSQEQVEKSISLNVETVTMKQFETTVLTYELIGISATTEIVWSSSDSSAVAVENGMITAFKTGTYVITVTAGNYSDTVTVNIEESSDVPQITLSQSDAKIKAGNTITVYSEVVFRGEAVEDQPEIEWTTTSDAITLTPKADGSVVITGVSATKQAVVQAKTTYFGKEIIKAIVVEVVEDSEFALSAATMQLYTYTYGEEYKENETLIASVTSSGNEVADAVIEWTTDDASVATVENGVVTAVSAGEATITAKYVSPSNVEYVKECIVTVSVPTIATGKSAKIYLDSAEGDQVVNLTEDWGIVNTAMQYKVIDVATNAEMPVSSDGANYTFAITDKKLCGERAVKLVVDGKVEMEATLTVVTKVLMTAEEVANIKNYGVLEDVTASGYTLYGYFLLGADVDMSSAGQFGIADYVAGESKGFIGGFDGQGHTIANLQVVGSGLFGEIAKGTVIRNTAFMNVSVNSVVSGALGQNCYGVIENCLIEVGFTYGTIMDNCSGVVDSVTGEGAAIRNCVVYYPETTQNSNAISRYLLSGGKLENVVVIGQSQLVAWDNQENTSMVNVMNYETGTSFSEIDFAFTQGDYWKFDGEKVYFAGYDVFLKSMINTGAYPTSITNGETVALPELPAPLNYIIEVADEYKEFITIDGNTLTIANDISGDFSFNITVSKWNGIDLEFSQSVSVVRIQNIVTKAVQEYVMNSGEMNINLADEITSDLPSDLTWKVVKGADVLSTITEAVTVNGKQLTIAANGIADSSVYGEVSLIGESVDGNYRIQIPALFITKVLVNADDLIAFASASQTGYFMLGGNIDATGLTINNASASFTGVFDGCGYVINGATYSTPDENEVPGGLFGAITAGSVVKNVALTGSKIYAFPYAFFGVMTGGATTQGTITDCYVEIVAAQSNVDGYNLMDRTSGLIGNGGGVTITNVIVKLADGVGLKNAITEMAHSGTHISNTYVIGGACERNNGWVDDTSSVSIESVMALSAEQQASFNSDIWEFKGGMPGFVKDTVKKTGITLDICLDDNDAAFGSKRIHLKDNLGVVGNNVESVTDNAGNAISFEISGEYLVVNPTTAGEQTIIVTVDGVQYVFTAIVITQVIDSTAELSAFASASQTGYYILGANIDASSLTINNAGATFTGTFDGRGYAIKGATYATPDENSVAGGLFGAIASGSVIKNLAMTGSKIYAFPYIYYGVLTGGATSLGTITNCYLEIVEAKANVEGYDLMNMTSGLVAHAGGGSISNVIIEYKNGAAVKFAVCEMIYGGTKVTNTYVVNSACTQNNGWVDAWPTSAEIVNVTTLSVEQQAAFDMDVWAFDEAGNPSFKKAN